MVAVRHTTAAIITPHMTPRVKLPFGPNKTHEVEMRRVPYPPTAKIVRYAPSGFQIHQVTIMNNAVKATFTAGFGLGSFAPFSGWLKVWFMGVQTAQSDYGGNKKARTQRTLIPGTAKRPCRKCAKPRPMGRVPGLVSTLVKFAVL